jgi:very-short-patch-repair endonuclease
MDPVTRARSLRQEQPPAQRRFWRLLRDRQFAGYKFRREHPLGDYVLDFYCAEAKLSLELDGAQHGFPVQHQRDEKKEAYLLSRGILTKRFWNRQVKEEPAVVKAALWRLLQERAPHPENVPVTRTARSRTWPPPAPDKKIPLRPNRLSPRVNGPAARKRSDSSRLDAESNG